MATREQLRSRRRAYYLRHRDRLLREFKERRAQQDKGTQAEYMKAYYTANRERIRARQREYWEKNKVRLNRTNSERRKAGLIKIDKDRKREWKRRQRRERPDVFREQQRKYLAENINVRIKRNLSRKVRRALLTTPRAASTIVLVGCSIEQLKRHLEDQFRLGMTWENYGTYWHIDHHIPCAAHRLVDPAEQRRCFHWTNLHPLTADENMRKNDIDPRTGHKASNHEATTNSQFVPCSKTPPHSKRTEGLITAQSVGTTAPASRQHGRPAISPTPRLRKRRFLG